MLVEQFWDPGLAHASYLVADPDAGVAFLVDPARDVEPYLAAAARLDVLITHSFETHVHNDYLTGSAALARLRPIAVVAGADAAIEYPHRAVRDGDVVEVGALALRCIATPGHTPEHVSYLVADRRRADDPQWFFSGGALLVGHIARVDLLGRELEERLARDAHRTLREKVLALADYVVVFPTHGGGSACTGGAPGSRWTTLGFERRHNAVALAASGDLDAFRHAIGHGLPEAPAYYPHVRALNARGPELPARLPLPFLSESAVRPMAATLLDPRPPYLFGAGHRRGALNVVGNDAFAIRVGATVPFGTPLVLLTEDPDHAERLREQLYVIGYDDVRGYAPPAPDGAELETLAQVEPRVAQERFAAGGVIVDVRERHEWDEGHVPGAVHVPFERIREAAATLPAGRVITYCASGVRSSLAASILQATGRDVRNLRGGFTAWRNAALPIAIE